MSGGLVRFGVGALAALLAVIPGGPADAASEGRKTTKPRVQVDEVPGDYIQLDPIWVPVMNRSGRPIYLGVVLRLYPGGETRFEACVTAPHVADWLIIEFNRHPMTREDYEDLPALKKRITDLIEKKAGASTYRQIEVMHDHQPPDEDSGSLSETCK